MRRRVNYSKPNSRPPQETRLIATILAEQADALLLVQLARGRYAGYWLLPSSGVDVGTVDAAARALLPARTGYQAETLALASVVEEPKTGVLAVRFVFRATVSARTEPLGDAEIAQARWFSRDAAREVLAERDVVPTLGVMALMRAWAEGIALPPLETLSPDDAPCPCGSGFRYRGCCGWDAELR